MIKDPQGYGHGFLELLKWILRVIDTDTQGYGNGS